MRNHSCVRAFALALIAASVAVGCAIRTPAAPGRGRAAPAASAISWPERWSDDLAGVAEQLPTAYVHRFTHPAAGSQGHAHGETCALRIATASAAQVHGRGIVRETWIGERNAHASLRFLSWLKSPDMSLVLDDSMAAFNRQHGAAATLTMPDRHAVRGLAVTIGPDSMHRWKLRDALPRHGWAVLHLGRVSTVDRGSPGTFELSASKGLPEQAKALAAELDRRLADYAYAVEGLLAWIRADQPELANVPTVVIGISRGALAVPAIVARNAEHVDAAVIMLGGVNLVDIAQRTTYQRQKVLRLRWVDEHGRPVRPDASQQKQLSGAYQQHSHLDPCHMAPHLCDLPVLVIDAMFDTIIPRDNGNALHERLGRPERWTYPFGHVVTFHLLNSRSRQIINWMDRAVGRASGLLIQESREGLYDGN